MHGQLMDQFPIPLAMWVSILFFFFLFSFIFIKQVDYKDIIHTIHTYLMGLLPKSIFSRILINVIQNDVLVKN